MKKIFAWMLTVLLLFSLVSCGAGAASDSGTLNESAADGNYGYAYKSESMYPVATEISSSLSSPAAGTEDTSVPTERKQIKTVDMELESRAFDSLMQEIYDRVKESGGYIERETQRNYKSDSNAPRRNSLVIRIPAEALEDFLTATTQNDFCSVTYKQEYVNDVTEAYIDIESRIRVLEAEESTLIALMEDAQKQIDSKSGNYSEIISSVMMIREHLLSVQSDLASYRAQFRSYAQKIAYSTVNLSVSEVVRYTEITENKTVWQEIGEKLSNNLYYIGQGFRSFFVWIVVSLPYIALWAVVLIAVFLILRRLNRKAEQKRRTLAQKRAEEKKQSTPKE